MSSRIDRYIFISLFFFLLFIGKVSGQNRASDTTIVITDTTNIDALFKKARELSYDNKFAQARRICQKILEKKPSYYDVRTFLGRTYAWEKQYDNARTELSRVLIEKENDYEAINALFDVEFWTESYSVAGDYLKVGLGFYPTSEELLLKKAKLQIKLEEKSEAAMTLHRILDLYPGQKEAINMMNTLEGRKLKNTFQTAFLVDLFDKKNPQQLVAAELGHNFNFGSYFIRSYFADRFGSKGFQYELENYTHFSKATYVNLLAGYSNLTSIFPKTKFSAEVYQKLSPGFEMSAGMRYLKYTTPTTVFTASLTNYYKDYYFNVRTFLTPNKEVVDTSINKYKDTTITVTPAKISFTIILSIRTYFGDPDNFFGIKVGTGSSPDEHRTADTKVLYYPTTQGGFELQKRAIGRWLLKCDLMYARETPFGGQYSKRISTTITLKTVF